MLIGIVKDVMDPLKTGRIRVWIKGRTDGIPINDLPWYYPKRIKDNHDLPKIDDKVYISLANNDIYFGFWEFLSQSNTLILEDRDYESAKVLLYRNLADNNDEGILEISYKKSIGFLIQLRNTKINIRPDHSVVINKDDTTFIDIIERMISIGTENKSLEIDKSWKSEGTSPGTKNQPAVNGTDNAHALYLLLKEINDYHKEMKTGLKALSTTAKSSPYTAPLSPQFDKLEIALSQVESKAFSAISGFIPETLSNIVVIDKN